LTLQGRFKHEINGDDIIFGIDADTKLRLPSGIGIAVKIAKWLDSAVEAELDGDTPKLLSPLLCAMNSLGVFKPDSIEVAGHSDEQSGRVINTEPEIVDESYGVPSVDIGKWSFHSRLVPENVTCLLESAVTEPESETSGGWFSSKKKNDTPLDLGSYEKRKKYFADEKRRTAVTISPDHVYCMLSCDLFQAWIFTMRTFA
jgi:hypothetical protein